MKTVGLFVEYFAKDEMVSRQNRRSARVVRLLSILEDYLARDSGYFAKYVSRAAEEIHDCYVGCGKEYKKTKALILVTPTIELSTEHVEE